MSPWWTVFKGKVYNLTPYLNFHPGGVKIMKSVLGKAGPHAASRFQLNS